MLRTVRNEVLFRIDYETNKYVPKEGMKPASRLTEGSFRYRFYLLPTDFTMFDDVVAASGGSIKLYGMYTWTYIQEVGLQSQLYVIDSPPMFQQ